MALHKLTKGRCSMNFDSHIVSRSLLVMLASFNFSATALAQNTGLSSEMNTAAAVSTNVSVVVRYPIDSIQSLEVADRVLREIDQERASIESTFAQEKRSCSQRFFVTACVDDVKERRRRALASIRDLELETNAYKRRMRVLERDNALSGKRATEAAVHQP
jgi:hypothetical protein